MSQINLSVEVTVRDEQGEVLTNQTIPVSIELELNPVGQTQSGTTAPSWYEAFQVWFNNHGIPINQPDPACENFYRAQSAETLYTIMTDFMNFTREAQNSRPETVPPFTQPFDTNDYQSQLDAAQGNQEAILNIIWEVASRCSEASGE